MDHNTRYEKYRRALEFTLIGLNIIFVVLKILDAKPSQGRLLGVFFRIVTKIFH